METSLTLDGLLALAAILVAILAIPRPVQRATLLLLAPKKRIILSLSLSLVLIVWRDLRLGLAPPFGWQRALVTYFLGLSAFLSPLAAIIWGIWKWHRPSLSKSQLSEFRGVIDAATREGEFAELERVVHANMERMQDLPPDGRSTLFNEHVVEGCTASRSLIHLRLLGSNKFRKDLPGTMRAVDIVTRSLLKQSWSPLYRLAESRYGDFDVRPLPKDHEHLLNQTFLSPEWYIATRAGYPLLMIVKEECESGKWDIRYNRNDPSYCAIQGRPSRFECPIFVASKAIAASLLAVVKESTTTAVNATDIYATDLYSCVQILSKRLDDRACRQACKCDDRPFVYLLTQVMSDIDGIACKSVAHEATDLKLDAPAHISCQVVEAWGHCLGAIHNSSLCASKKEKLIEPFFRFLLTVGWRFSELDHFYNGSAGLETWASTYAISWRKSSFDAQERHEIVEIGKEGLDHFKPYIGDHIRWLEDLVR